MFKRLSVLLLLASCSQYLFSQSAGTRTLYNTIKNKGTYETYADSMTNAFIESFMIKAKGIFNVRYNYYQDNIYWQQAHAIDVVIYNYQRHKGIDATLASNYLKYIKFGTGTRPTTTKEHPRQVLPLPTPLRDIRCSRTLIPTICAGLRSPFCTSARQQEHPPTPQSPSRFSTTTSSSGHTQLRTLRLFGFPGKAVPAVGRMLAQWLRQPSLPQNSTRNTALKSIWTTLRNSTNIPPGTS